VAPPSAPASVDGAAVPPEGGAFGAGLDRLRDGFLRRLAHPGALRAAAALPLTRPLARRSAAALFDLVSGFVYTQILLACVRLELFPLLLERARRPEELAPRLGLDLDATRQLLDAAVAVGVLKRRFTGRYAPTTLGLAIATSPGIQRMIEHNLLLYRDLEDPVALLRGERPADTALAAYWPYAGERPGAFDADAARPYSELMGASQDLVAHEVLDAWDFSRHRRLLDVGGGNGTFLAAVVARHPALEGVLFDLPPVAALAEERFREAGLGDRVEAVGGSFLEDPLPTGADVVSLVRVLHDQDDARARSLLAAVHGVLPPGGTLLVAEPMRGARAARRVGDAYFAFYLRAMGRGRPRSPEEIEGLLREAGFLNVRARPTHVPLQTSVLVADRP
jgi:demethylspheroidene O-methyltransferase